MTEPIDELKLLVKLLTNEMTRFGNQQIKDRQELHDVRDRVALMEKRLPKEWSNDFWSMVWKDYRESGGRFVLGTPGRIQRTQVVQSLPPNCKSVTRPTLWANQFIVGVNAKDAAEAKELFREYLDQNPELVARARKKLRGYHLACYCPLDQPCHADVWLELVND
jgi:hypothetical protein